MCFLFFKSSYVISRRTYVNDFTRGIIAGKLEDGHSARDVGNEFEVPKNVVPRLWKHFSKNGSATTRYRSGRPHKTITQEELFMTLIAKHNRILSDCQVTKQFHADTGMTILRQTKSMCLNDIGFFARKPLKCILLTRARKIDRYWWFSDDVNWTNQQRSSILFTDERGFTFSPDSTCHYIWRKPGAAFNSENILEVHYYRPGIMLWTRIMVIPVQSSFSVQRCWYLMQGISMVLLEMVW